MSRTIIDTCTLLWWLGGDSRLSVEAKRTISDPGGVLMVSAASAYEIAFKHNKGKLTLSKALAASLAATVESQGFSWLPLSERHCADAGRLQLVVKDPFDRLISAQALSERVSVITPDEAFDRLGVHRIW